MAELHFSEYHVRVVWQKKHEGSYYSGARVQPRGSSSYMKLKSFQLPLMYSILLSTVDCTRLSATIYFEMFNKLVYRFCQMVLPDLKQPRVEVKMV